MKGTEKTRIRRLPQRAEYSWERVAEFLDQCYVCHVGFVQDSHPFVIPMSYARRNQTLLLHGSKLSRLVNTLADGVEASICVTRLDGLVLARSVFHHSMNYRSAVLFGRCTLIDDLEEKKRALEDLVEGLVPGRGADARPPDSGELKATEILEFQVEGYSLKMREGGPNDPAKDMSWNAWAGVVPFSVEPGTPVTDPGVPVDLLPPDYVHAIGHRPPPR